jgi:hypothetical protein
MKKDRHSSGNETEARLVIKDLCVPVPQTTHALQDQPLTHKRIRWTKFVRGDLVQVKMLRSTNYAEDCFGVVLDGYDSNVYEPASASVLVGDSIFHYTDRDIELISPIGDDS